MYTGSLIYLILSDDKMNINTFTKRNMVEMETAKFFKNLDFVPLNLLNKSGKEKDVKCVRAGRCSEKTVGDVNRKGT